MTTEERLIKLETRYEEHEKQTGDKFAEYDKKIESIEKLTIETHDLTNSVKQLAEGMTGVNSKIDTLDEKVDRLENRDGEQAKKVLAFIASALGGGFLTYLCTLFF